MTVSPEHLCASAALQEGGEAVAFDVQIQGATYRAFVVRFEGRPHAYLNRCTHVAVEMDHPSGRFFDDSGRWLVCATHGAVYAPDTGACAGGPCGGGLLKIEVSEQGGQVFWHPDDWIRPVAF